MTSNIQIVRLGPKDWELYRAIRLESLKEEPAAFLSSYEDKVKSPPENWQKHLKETEVMLFVKNADRIIGVASAFCEKDQKIRHVARIVGVYLNKNYRGQGMGRLLLARVLEEIRKMPGIKKIKVEVSENQFAAYELYKKMGFKEIGRAQNEICLDGKYYDEILMEMLL